MDNENVIWLSLIPLIHCVTDGLICDRDFQLKDASYIKCVLQMPIKMVIQLVYLEPGPHLNLKTAFSRYGDFYVNDKMVVTKRLIFNMRIPILLRWHLNIEMDPWALMSILIKFILKVHVLLCTVVVSLICRINQFTWSLEVMPQGPLLLTWINFNPSMDR